MRQHRAQESFQPVACLKPEFARQAGLMQACRVEKTRQQRQGARSGQGQQQRERVGWGVLVVPPVVAGQRDGDVAVGMHRIADQQAQHLAIGQQPGTLPAGQQHP